LIQIIIINVRLGLKALFGLMEHNGMERNGT